MFWKKEKKETKKKGEEISPETTKNFENNEEKKVEQSNSSEILGGKYGDTDIRTKQSLRWNRLFGVLMVLLATGVIITVIGQVRYHNYIVSNSTKIGTPLTFKMSEAKLQLKGVYTDKNYEVTVVQLGYNNLARQSLSYKGTNYGINFVVKNKSDIPQRTTISYGLLGTEGDGYLIINGKLKNEAYQVFILNRLTFDSGDNAASAQNQSELEQESIASMMSGSDLGSANKNGIMDLFSSGESSTTQDTINFRVNPYSDNTVVSEVSYKDKKGNIDYTALLKDIGIKDLIRQLNAADKVSKENIEKYENAVTEYQDRLKINKEDETSQAELKKAQENLALEKANVDKYKEQKKALKSAEFDEDSFININKKYKVIDADDIPNQ